MVPWNVAGRTQCKIGPRVTPINSSTTKSGTRVKRDSRLAMYATTSRTPTIPNISVNCTMRISPVQHRTRIDGRTHHIRKSGDAIDRMSNYRKLDTTATFLGHLGSNVSYAALVRNLAHAIHASASSVSTAIIPCEITQYRHHTPRTRASMFVKYKANPIPIRMHTSNSPRRRINPKTPISRYPTIPMAATGTPWNTAYGLWFTTPQSHLSLILQGSEPVS